MYSRGAPLVGARYFGKWSSKYLVCEWVGESIPSLSLDVVSEAIRAMYFTP